MISEDIVDELYMQAYGDIMKEFYVIKNGTPHFHYRVNDQVHNKIKLRFASLLEQHITDNMD